MFILRNVKIAAVDVSLLYPAITCNAYRCTSLFKCLDLTLVNSYNRLVRGNPLKSVEIIGGYGIGGVFVYEEACKIEGLVYVKLDLVLHELNVTVGIIEGNVADRCVHRIVVDVEGQATGHLGCCDNIEIIGDLEADESALATVFLINRNGIFYNRRISKNVGLLGFIEGLINRDRTNRHCVVIIVYSNVRVISVLVKSLVKLGSELIVNDTGSLVVDVEGEGICIGNIISTVPVELRAHGNLKLGVVVTDNLACFVIYGRKVNVASIGIRRAVVVSLITVVLNILPDNLTCGGINNLDAHLLRTTEKTCKYTVNTADRVSKVGDSSLVLSCRNSSVTGS